MSDELRRVGAVASHMATRLANPFDSDRTGPGVEATPAVAALLASSQPGRSTDADGGYKLIWNSRSRLIILETRFGNTERHQMSCCRWLMNNLFCIPHCTQQYCKKLKLLFNVRMLTLLWRIMLMRLWQCRMGFILVHYKELCIHWICLEGFQKWFWQVCLCITSLISCHCCKHKVLFFLQWSG